MSFLFKPFYAGKGKGNRVIRHFSEFDGSNKFKERVIKKIQKQTGKNPDYIFYKKDMLEQNSLDLEIEIIKKIGRRDLGLGPLTNLTDGGENPTNSPEIKKKRIENTKKFYKEHPEAGEKISKQSRERWENEDYKNRLIQIHKKRHKNNPENKKLIGLKVSKFYEDNPEARERQSKMSKGESNGNSKLSKKQVVAILTLLSRGWLQCHIRKVFNICFTYVNQLKHGDIWPHLKGEYPELFEKMQNFNKMSFSLNPRQIKNILKLKKDGKNTLEISKDLKLKYSPVFRVVNRFDGIPYAKRLKECKLLEY